MVTSSEKRSRQFAEATAEISNNQSQLIASLLEQNARRHAVTENYDMTTEHAELGSEAPTLRSDDPARVLEHLEKK